MTNVHYYYQRDLKIDECWAEIVDENFKDLETWENVKIINCPQHPNSWLDMHDKAITNLRDTAINNFIRIS